MGVKGLSTFAKDNRQSICRTINLYPANNVPRVPAVVDAWGIIYQLWLSTLPWQSGGEYLLFYRIVLRLVHAWRAVAIEPIFVFDGSAPPEKHDTLLKRSDEQIRTAQLFYTTSPASRSSPSFSRSRTILSALASQTFIHALQDAGVEARFAPAGEADGLVVRLAEERAGWVFGLDSDYLILISTPGLRSLKGYCPFDMMSWVEERASEPRPSDGWSIATRPTQTTRGCSPLLPPFPTARLQLVVIPPTAIRARLRMPPQMMPLFASLVGNDYTPPIAAEHFFEPALNMSQRIEKAARIIREVVFAPSRGTGKGNVGDHAVDLVRRVVAKIAWKPFATDGVMMGVIERIIEATVQYVLPAPGVCCDEYPFCGELARGVCGAGTGSRIDEGVHAARRAYARAQARGMLNHTTHVYLYPERVYLWGVLEDPAGPSLKAGEGARGVRTAAAMWADEGLGGLNYPVSEGGEDDEEGAVEIRSGVGTGAGDDMDVELERTERPDAEREHGAAANGRGDREGNGEGERSGDADSDEAAAALLGVVLADDTENNDTKCHVHDSAIDTTTSTTQTPTATMPPRNSRTPSPPSSCPPAPRRSIIEYARHTNRHAPFRIDLPSPPIPSPALPSSSSPKPMCIRPLAERLKAYLEPLHSLTPTILALPPALQPIAALVRFCVLEAAARVAPHAHAHAQARAGPNDPRWRASEVRAVLRACVGTYGAWGREKGRALGTGTGTGGSGGGGGGGENDLAHPLLTTRNSHIVAQLASAITDSLYLAQALLLLPHADTEPVDMDESGAESVVGPSIAVDGDSEPQSQSNGARAHGIPAEVGGSIPAPTPAPASASASDAALEAARETAPRPTRKRRLAALTHLTPFVWFSGITLHALLSGETPTPPPPRGVSWEWSDRDEGVLGRVMGGVRAGIAEGVVLGWDVEEGRAGSDKARDVEDGSEGRKGEGGEKEGANDKEGEVGKKGGGRKGKGKGKRKSSEMQAQSQAQAQVSQGGAMGRYALLGAAQA